MNKINITLAGCKNDPYLFQCKAALDFIKSKDPYVSSTELAFFETEWEQYLLQLQKIHGGPFLTHQSSPLIFLHDSEYIGGINEFLDYADEKYDYRDTKDFSVYTEACDVALKKTYMENPYRKYCYMTITVGKTIPVVVIFELFCDIAPKTCHNFIELCKGFPNSEGNKIGYENCEIHRVVAQAFVQAGRIKNGSSVYEKEFADESFSVRHDTLGILGMVKRAGLPNTNNFEFYVTLAAPLTFMDKNYVAFGRVVQGFKVFKKMEKLQLDINQKPETICKIDICGE